MLGNYQIYFSVKLLLRKVLSGVVCGEGGVVSIIQYLPRYLVSAAEKESVHLVVRRGVQEDPAHDHQEWEVQCQHLQEE